jgi:hypothetical protein
LPPTGEIRLPANAAQFAVAFAVILNAVKDPKNSTDLNRWDLSTHKSSSLQFQYPSPQPNQRHFDRSENPPPSQHRAVAVAFAVILNAVKDPEEFYRPQPLGSFRHTSSSLKFPLLQYPSPQPNHRHFDRSGEIRFSTANSNEFPLKDSPHRSFIINTRWIPK